MASGIIRFILNCSAPNTNKLVALAGVVGAAIGIKPKRRDDWLVVPNLWGGVIGPPTKKKTPARPK